ncbi:hypothetical protein CPB85DRAFT_1432728 [Mucidula mucida]|nr:hypothetical protein CPB85DRAFT_1432728 [Mucidula mucida]
MSLRYPHTDFPCSSSFSLWEGPVCANATEDLIVTAVLEPGARESCCGFHLVICCDSDLHEIIISGSDVGSIDDYNTDPPNKRKGCEILQAEQEAVEAVSEEIRASGVWPRSLPPYELVLEVYPLDKRQKSYSDGIRSIKLIHDAASMRKLYEVLVPDTSSLFLYLRSNRVFRSNPSGDPRGILTADVRLLPPSRHHQSFQQPPSEILHRIFQCAYDNEPDNFCWRPHFLSFALVCRAWRAPALDCLYEDLDASCSTDVDLVAVAEAVKRSPAFGAAIRRLDHYLHVPPGHGLFDQNDYQVAKALIDIIQSAPGLQKLLVASIPKSLKAALLQALCSTCQSMGSFWMYAAPPVLDMGDLFSAFGHWKRLHTLKLYEWKSYENILVNNHMKPERTPPLACPLIQLSLSKGHITGYQFQNLTAGAHATLTVLELNAIDGLTNDTFKSALLLLAPPWKGLI